MWEVHKVHQQHICIQSDKLFSRTTKFYSEKSYLPWLANLSPHLMKSRSHPPSRRSRYRTQASVVLQEDLFATDLLIISCSVPLNCTSLTQSLHKPLLIISGLLSLFKVLRQTCTIWLFLPYWTRATEKISELARDQLDNFFHLNLMTKFYTPFS